MQKRYQSLIIIICLVTLLSILGCTNPPRSDQRIHIVFRYDDYSVGSNHEFTTKLLDLFRKYDASITFGVTPFSEPNNQYHDPLIRQDQIIPLTDENEELLRKGLAEERIEIALHGYSHQNNNGEKATEFSGLDYNSQLERLTKGKSFLEQVVNSSVSIFIPPWNDYDLNTLLALDELGFSIISARGRGVRSDQAGLAYLPFSCTLENLEQGMTKARETDKEDILLVVLLHEYEFTDFSHPDAFISFKDFSKMMKWLSRQKEVEIINLEEALNYQHNLVYCY